MATTSRKFYLTDGVLTFGLTITSATTTEQIVSMVKNKVPDKSASYVLDADNDMVALDALFNTTPNTKDTPYKIGFDDNKTDDGVISELRTQWAEFKSEFSKHTNVDKGTTTNENMFRKLWDELTISSSRKAYLELFQNRRYSIHRVLYCGHTLVFGGFDSLLQKDVAFKIARSETVGKLFSLQWESRMLKQLSSCSCVPQLIDYLDFPEYSVLVESPVGMTLDKYLHSTSNRMGTLKSLIPQLISGLTEIHSFEIVHYDIKPSNIIVVIPSKRICFIDFGNSAFSGTGSHIGTRKYASANQLQGGAACFHDDFEQLFYTLYALEVGVELFEQIKDRPSVRTLRIKSGIVKKALAELGKARKSKRKACEIY